MSSKQRQQQATQGASMPLMSHLVELRNRLVWALVALGIGASAAFTFGNQLIDILLVPFPDDIQIVQIDLLEGIRVRMKVALLGGFMIALPIILYQVIMFVRPALLPHERRFLMIGVPIVSAFYIAGVAFSFFVLIPPMMNMLPRFLGESVTPQIRIDSVVGTTVWFLFIMGLLFEIPIVMYLLARVGVMDPRVVGKQRRLAIVFSFVAGAVITPTGDPINMTIWGLPIWGLYEIGLLFARLALWQRQRSALRKARAK